jgi:hypothetical protein
MLVDRTRWVLGSAVALLLVAMALVPSAHADLPSLYGPDLPCADQSGNGDVRLCAGTTETWDGTKIDVNVILPPAPSTGADGPYPLIGDFHGWGGEKIGLNAQTQDWAEDGYAVFSMSDVAGASPAASTTRKNSRSSRSAPTATTT